MSVLAVARVPLPFTIEKYAGSDIWILWVVDIMLNKQLMSALFITAQKALFAVPGCSVLLYLVASAMGAFHRRYYPYNPSLSLTMMLLRWRNRG
jgi:hypothetical protein